MSLRIGIDVGGTNTDAVLMDGLTVISKIKTPTTEDVTSGITTALRHVLDTSGTATNAAGAVSVASSLKSTNTTKARKKRNNPGERSFTREVPSGVPSVTHSSWPVVPSSAVKKTWLPITVR